MKLYFDLGTLFIMKLKIDEIEDGKIINNIEWNSAWNHISMNYILGHIPMRKL